MADTRPRQTGSPDRFAVFDETTELGRDYAAVDWAASPLGPISEWSASLKNTVRLMLSSRFAIWMAWGPELVFFCNDDYRRDTLGAKYPWALGRRASEVWAEIWADVVDRVHAVTVEGLSTWDEGLMLFLERSGYVEETYHTFSYSPLTDDDGRIAGLLCVVSEDTGRVVSERRITTLRDLATGLAGATTEPDVHEAAQRQLTTDPYNLPFVVAYLVDGTVAHRAWTVGIDPGHPAAPASVDLVDHVSPWARGAADDRQVIELAGVFDELPTGAWNDPPTRAVTIALRRAGHAEPYGFLVIALNRHRPLDHDYLGFLDLLAGQISAAITRARAFETERLRAEQIAELDRAKTAFFTNVSHELRTPLTLLLGPAEDALADTDLAPVQRGRIEVVHRNAERLLKLVDTLLEFSRLESGRLQARYEPVDLARYTEELAGMFESALHRAGLYLDVACEPQAEPFFVDREMWAKIVLNLVSNALKATFAGGITVRLAAFDGGARLRVADTGIGIPAQEQKRLFERFHRVSGAALRTHEGSGIGLALVAELANLHSGRVTVDSDAGAGATFSVWLPSGSTHLPAGSVVGTTTAGPSAGSLGAGYLAEALRWVDPGRRDDLAPAADDDGRHTVLVADDNADMRDYVSGLLDDHYRVVTAADGAIALELAGAMTPDLVLTDVMMPNLDGFGLLTALRADPSTMHIPVIMLSARSGDEAAVEGLELGADDYLVKPFSGRELLARIRANLELDRVRRLVKELARNRTMLTRAEAMAGVGSYEWDIATDHATGSAELLRLLGVSADDLANHGLTAALDGIHADDVDRVAAAVQHTVATGDPLGVEYRIVDPAAATSRVVWATGAVERDADGTPVRVAGSVQDITDRRRAEEASVAEAAAREAEAREHAIALELQRSLLPKHAFDADHLDVATFYQAGVERTEVGGDWYDVIDLDAGRTALVLGDVMGRGVRAAAIMGQLRATVRAYTRVDVAPDLLLHLLDSAVREISEDTIVTCVYAVYDPAKRSLVYANAGHLPPLLTVPGGGTTRLTAGGPPLGTGRTWTEPETLVLPPGAVVTLYTDGLVEDRGTNIDVRIDALADLLTTAGGPIADRPAALVEALRPHGTDDDIAVLMAGVSPDSGLDRAASRRFEPDVGIARLAREFTSTHLSAWDVPDATDFDVQLVVSELATNAFRHGRPPIDVDIRRSRDRVFVNVHDTAAASPRMRHPGTTDNSGRGLLIVASIAERWGTRQTGTGKAVWAVVRIQPVQG